jgi:UDP-N-acetylmuramate--alanine ligase
MQSSVLAKNDSFYFVGIGGVSMSALAKYLVAMGKRVAGFDRCESEFTLELKSMGVDVDIQNPMPCKLNLFDVVVFTDAVPDDDILIVYAKKFHKKMLSRGQLLYEVSRQFGCVIGVAGCHGKTTCTAMLAHIFACAHKNFAVHMGGKDSQFSNFFMTGNDYFITEACEYKRNFLLLKPTIAVILNSAADHLECYQNAEKLKQAYLEFGKGASVSFNLYRDLPTMGHTFGLDKRADFHAEQIQDVGAKYSFLVVEKDKDYGEFALDVYGKHNVLNALAAFAVAREVGIDADVIREGLLSFHGVKRRFEKIGTFNGCTCIADYAHHPDEIKATVRTAKELCKGRLFVVFQPHTYSRTRNLFGQFVNVLAPLQNLLVYKTFAAREYFDDAGSAYTLFRALKKAKYADNSGGIVAFLKDVQPNDVVLFLGAGDIYEIAKRVVDTAEC